MDRWIRTYALALLLVLLLAPGAVAATVQATPLTESVTIEIVSATPTSDAIIITGDSADVVAYIIAYPATPASVAETGGGADTDGIFTVETRNDTLSAADYITIYPAAPATTAKEAGGAAPPVYDAAAEKTATRTQPAVPVLSFSRYYSQDVPSPGKTLWVDMRWEGDGDHALTVYHPGGILGTFRDGSDGKEDGRIFLRFSRESGVAVGAWTFKTTVPLVASRENVTFQTYLE
ncbi:hypothetical protein [Methanofollis sp. UBA420]|jgi:hypothetical protein|uniref:hypothetical protein n=1 Tax=Methanofollis sp. UBA420 TaxID=1915514 RepID=UPI00316ADE25